MKLLIITDHTSHKRYDSIYHLTNEFINHDKISKVFVSCRSINSEHFDARSNTFYCKQVLENLSFEQRASFFSMVDQKSKSYLDFDIVLFRVDRPISDKYLRFVDSISSSVNFINSPLGLINTSSKEYLNNVKELCPEFVISDKVQEIISFAKKKPIVLKPLGGYGGNGISGLNMTHINHNHLPKLSENAAKLHISNQLKDYEKIMAMTFLSNVSKGDKRIIIANGKIVGAVLRIPKRDNWLCNVACGASTISTEITEEEVDIVNKLTPLMKKEKISLYGIDTIMNDDNKWVLSEINTTNVGGFIQMDQMYNKNHTKDSVNYLLSDY